jgi:hypothetical protein
MATQTAPTVSDLLRELATLRQSPVLCLYHDQSAGEELDDRCLQQVLDVAPQLEQSDKLSIMIDSPGGDIESAYRIVKFLRQFAENVEVLVPNWAKSAATFVCLSADSIHMGPNGELGPLDPQTVDPTGKARRISALETFKGMEHLRNYSLETLDAIVILLVRRSGMDIPYALEHAGSLFSSIVTPLYQQIDPHELGEFGRYLAVSEEYAMRVMQRWSYKDRDEQALKQIVSTLVWDYPTHGFVIDLHEARKLGLNAVALDKESNALCQTILSMVPGWFGLSQPESNPCPSTGDAETTQEEDGKYGRDQENNPGAKENGDTRSPKSEQEFT